MLVDGIDKKLKKNVHLLHKAHTIDVLYGIRINSLSQSELEKTMHETRKRNASIESKAKDSEKNNSIQCKQNKIE